MSKIYLYVSVVSMEIVLLILHLLLDLIEFPVVEGSFTDLVSLDEVSELNESNWLII